MRHYIRFIAIAAAAAATLLSCSRQFDETGPAPKKAPRLIFEGGFGTTRTAYGEAADGVYQLTWTKGDAIGIFSFDQAETMNENMKAELLDISIGSPSGLFAPVDNIYTVPAEEEGADPITVVESLKYPQDSDEKFFIYYPFKAGTAIDVETASVSGTLDSRQFQETLGDRKIGPNGFSTAMASVRAGSNKVSFTLDHKMVYICFKASSTEFADSQLHGVQLFDKNGGAALAGAWSYNPLTGVLAAGESVKASASVEIAEHDFKSAPAANELYLTVLPGDFSAADMYVVVTFMKEDGSTITIPKKFDKTCKFPAGTLTTLDLGDVKSSDNIYPWYEPMEKRDLIGFYAYGHANTYYAVRPVRSEEDKAAGKKTYTTVHIDAKARGDFSRVVEPKYYALLSPSEMGCGSLGVSVRRFLSLDKEGNEVKRTDLPEHAIDADYSFDVYVLDQGYCTGRWGTVAIYDKDYNLIWSYMVIGYVPDDEPQDIVYPEGFTLLDRYLGQAYGPKKAAELGKFDDPSCAFFQWGRKDPLTWTNTNGLAYYKFENADETTSIETAIKNPTTVYGYLNTSGRNTYGDWQQADGQRNDLWGGYNNTDKEWFDPEEKGHKTVFDPCPDGYRVPDTRVFKAITDKTEIWESTNKSSLQVHDATAEGYYMKPDSPWYSTTSGKGVTVLAVPVAGAPYEKDGVTYDVFPWGGFLYSSGSYTNRSGSVCDYALEVWANAFCNSDPKHQGSAACMEYGYWSTARLFNDRHSAQKGQRNSVRCQKED